MQRIYVWLRERPRLVDLVIAGFCLLVSVPTGLAFAFEGEPVAGLLAVLICLPLAWRRSHPVAAGYTTAVLGFAALAVSSFPPPSGFLAAVVMAYTMAAYAPRRHARAALVLSVAGGAGTAARTVLSEYRYPSADLLFMAAVLTVAASAPLVVAWLWGGVVRARLAYLQEALDRAERLEREREALARVAVVEERARIAREMHDVVAHGVTVMVLQADGAAYVLDSDPQRTRRALENISRTGRESLAEMRRLLGLLRTDGRTQPLAGAPPGVGALPDATLELPAIEAPTIEGRLVEGPFVEGRPVEAQLNAAPPVFAPQPGLDRIDELVEQIRGAGLPVHLETSPPPGPVPVGIGLSAYRIVQEALTNTLKHAGPQATAEVRLDYQPDALEIRVVDDGRGAAATSDGNGHGMIGMRERVAALGGQLLAGPRPGGGFLVRARLPYQAAMR